MRNDLSIDFLKECFVYDEATGKLIWRARPRHHFTSDAGMARTNTKKTGVPVGSLDHRGYDTTYLQVNGRKVRYFCHRLIWALHYRAWPAKEIDHINGNRADNRIENLREATSAENKRNTPLRKDNTSGYKGVSLVKGTHKYRSRIRVNRKLIHLGDFSDPETAHAAYVSAAHRYHGQFVRRDPT